MECQLELQQTQTVAADTAMDEELANSITHGIGLVMSLAGAVVLLTNAAKIGPYWVFAGCLVYIATLVAVYGASTLSHVAPAGAWRHRFRVIDQAAIYTLIAGNITPIALAYMCHDSWWMMLVAIWGMSLAGFCSKMLWAHRVESVSTVSYALIAWTPLLAIPNGFSTIPAGALWWGLAGGICYSLGVIFLVNDRKVPYFHSVWHLLVIAGSACHFYVVLEYVVGQGA